jgi:hypothetical protein
MIAVEFKAVRPGACGWCRKEKDEVYDVAFSDKSFVGPMCKADLMRAIGMKVGREPKLVVAGIPGSAPPVGNGAGAVK